MYAPDDPTSPSELGDRAFFRLGSKISTGSYALRYPPIARRASDLVVFGAQKTDDSFATGFSHHNVSVYDSIII